jgi:hypothetical protein
LTILDQVQLETESLDLRIKLGVYSLVEDDLYEKQQALDAQWYNYNISCFEPKLDIIVIDFYNVYCWMTSFHKNKTFSRKSFYKCLYSICEKFKLCKKIYIVSKEFYESDGAQDISKFLKEFDFTNVVFYSVKADLNTKKYKEIDDFFYLHLYFVLRLAYPKLAIKLMTQDTHKNYDSIVSGSIEMWVLETTHRSVSARVYSERDLVFMRGLLSEYTTKDICYLKYGR